MKTIIFLLATFAANSWAQTPPPIYLLGNSSVHNDVLDRTEYTLEIGVKDRACRELTEADYSVYKNRVVKTKPVYIGGYITWTEVLEIQIQVLRTNLADCTGPQRDQIVRKTIRTAVGDRLRSQVYRVEHIYINQVLKCTVPGLCY